MITLQRIRDYQRSKVYKAERLAVERCVEAGISLWEVGTDIHAVQAWVTKATMSAWWKRRDYFLSVRVNDGRGCSIARGGSGEIKLPMWARSDLVPVHELAHACISVFRISESWHGREFCKRFLEMVQHFYGKSARDILRQAMKECGVRIKGTDRQWAERVKRKRERRSGTRCSQEVLDRLTKARAVRAEKMAARKSGD